MSPVLCVVSTSQFDPPSNRSNLLGELCCLVRSKSATPKPLRGCPVPKRFIVALKSDLGLLAEPSMIRCLGPCMQIIPRRLTQHIFHIFNETRGLRASLIWLGQVGPELFRIM